MAKLCQRAEHEFAGVQCGIMDQFISRLGRRHHALKIDCRSLAYEHVPFPAGVGLIVCNTNVRRGLASSEYNQRRAECAAAVAGLARMLPSVGSLRDVTPEQFRELEDVLEPVVRKRGRHVVTEIARVTGSVAALRSGDLPLFGRLMLESHASLRDDYAVSCAELDAVVDICMESGQAFGARMTGAGFGGCAICLAPESATELITGRLRAEYPPRTGKRPDILVCTPDDGATVQRM
jgi:galactokinase